MRLSKEHSRKRWNGLRDAVNEWDSVGLIELGAPVDEYECLVGPLMRMLEKNICPEEIAGYLTQHVPDHFGVSPPDGAQEFSEEIVNWFLTQWKNTTV
jgi:hypothetical protein